MSDAAVGPDVTWTMATQLSSIQWYLQGLPRHQTGSWSDEYWIRRTLKVSIHAG
jgi:hypothetical protein